MKPAPDALHLALRKMSTEAGETAIVGDTENDVLAGRAVPMPVIAVASPYGGRQKLIAAGPDFFIESISDLVPTLETHNHSAARLS